MRRVVSVVAAGALLITASAGQTADIVLYASDVSVIGGNWIRLPSTSGAGGQKMTSSDAGWASPSVPLASPRDYFEAEFDAAAGVAYRLWLRLRAAGNSSSNDSVWVQFSGAVDQHGASLWPIGSTSALLVNLEDCRECGLSGWGWQDNSWWLEQPSVVRFRTTGRQKIRIQTREDGVDVDQIVLSAGTYFWSPPGRTRDDGVIVAKSGGSTVSVLRAPYVQHVTDSSAVVVWTTKQPGRAELRIAEPGGGVRTVFAESRAFGAAQTQLPYDFYQHEARVTGLSPGARYGYTILLDGTALTAGHDAFTTAPPRGTGSVRFIAFGDSGVGLSTQRELAALMTADWFDLAIHTGDVAYGTPNMEGGGNYAQYDDWVFGIYTAWMRQRPFFPSFGNHDDEIDFGRPYLDVFVLPENGASPSYLDHAERYYSFDYGPVHFVALDTERSFLDPARRQAQLAWLEADLASTQQPWRIVYFHRAPYTAGSRHGSALAVRHAFVPIFEKYGVQLVVAAHEHLYERSIPWREYISTGSHVTYVVTGGGGAALYEAGTAPWTAFSAAMHHYTRFAVDGCSLRGEVVAIGGQIADAFEIQRCEQPRSPSVPSPQSSTSDIVLYATDVSVISGNWSRLPSWSGADNTKMTSEDRGWSSIEAPLAAPGDYFEAAFDAPAGAYRLWLRLRAAGDSRWNDSVWVQFSDAAAADGTTLWPIGTNRALLVNLEDCSACGVSGWGWQDNSWWLGESSIVRFATGGRHRIRIQTREDGVDVDQIVLSPERFFASAPGSVRGDQTVVPKF